MIVYSVVGTHVSAGHTHKMTVNRRENNAVTCVLLSSFYLKMSVLMKKKREGFNVLKINVICFACLSIYQQYFLKFEE